MAIVAVMHTLMPSLDSSFFFFFNTVPCHFPNVCGNNVGEPLLFYKGTQC